MAAVMMTQMPVMMTPHMATAAVFQQPTSPWVTQTPESSPMLWNCAPSPDSYGLNPFDSSQKCISKEFLRAVCEPFFDQMLTAIYQTLQAQNQQAMHVQGHCMGAQVSATAGHQQVSATGVCNSYGLPTCEEPSTEDGSDVSDAGAFSAILTPPSAEEEQVKKTRWCDVEAESDAEEDSDMEATAMVCRHWKSKGWCRLEKNCKFLHPEHQRGVSFTTSSKSFTAMDNSNVDSSITSEQLAFMPADGKKKNNKRGKRKNRAAGLKQDVEAAQAVLNGLNSASEYRQL
jgi:hypothetical protein